MHAYVHVYPGEMMDAAEDAGSEISIAVACMRPVKVLARQVGVNLERLKSTMHGSDGMGKSLLMRKLSAVALAGAAEACASGGKEMAGVCPHLCIESLRHKLSVDVEMSGFLRKNFLLDEIGLFARDKVLSVFTSYLFSRRGTECRALCLSAESDSFQIRSSAAMCAWAPATQTANRLDGPGTRQMSVKASEA